MDRPLDHAVTISHKSVLLLPLLSAVVFCLVCSPSGTSYYSGLPYRYILLFWSALQELVLFDRSLMRYNNVIIPHWCTTVRVSASVTFQQFYTGPTVISKNCVECNSCFNYRTRFNAAMAINTPAAQDVCWPRNFKFVSSLSALSTVHAAITVWSIARITGDNSANSWWQFQQNTWSSLTSV